MDNFMDKIAQKLNSQDLIKANSDAEAAELKRLQTQVAEYEKILQSMRQVNLKSSEITAAMEQVLEQANSFSGMDQMLEQVNTLIQDAKIDKVNSEIGISTQIDEQFGAQKLQFDEQKEQLAVLKGQVISLRDMLEMQFENQRQDANEDVNVNLTDFIHTESVKVYRNVQAVIGQGQKDQVKRLDSTENRIVSQFAPFKKFAMIIVGASVASAVFGLFNLIIAVLNLLGITLF